MANLIDAIPEGLLAAGVIGAGMVVLTLAGMVVESRFFSSYRRRPR